MKNYLDSLFGLNNKVVIITGGLGILGTEYVKALAQGGARVAVFDLHKPSVENELTGYSKKYPIKFYQVNITKRSEVEKALVKVKKSWETPSVLINNAALDFPPDKNKKESLENYPMEKWNAVLEVNLTGMLICCQVIGGAMAEKQRGSIINISSTYGVVSPDQRIYKNFIKPVSYCVTKAGVLNLTRYLATYWSQNKVRVNTLTLGGVFNNQDEDFIKRYSSRTPLGRMARRDEYVGAILFLSSEASSYMTGSNLIMDGGWTAW